ncbi:MAG: MoaD/ThiS family protein [Anaerolinea sp.]|nr:MoaD/ThiS family protein [Anaerolinea sp.]
MMDLKPSNGHQTATLTWTLSGLTPTPEEEWERLQTFLAISKEDVNAMLATVEPLFRRGHELVVGTYDYLLAHHETAVILGWDKGADPAHLAERRRFFTVWLARTLGLDRSHEFARYLFRAGQIHAAHGPRQIHVPERYVTGSISLVNATFARFLMEEMPGDARVPAALAGWNKLLSLHLHMMLQGYQSARAWDSGDFPVTVLLFGKMRTLTHRQEQIMQLTDGETMAQVLRKFFNYYPQTRPEVFDVTWQDGERLDESGTPWLTVTPQHQLKHGWRVLRNGRHLAYTGGLTQPVSPNDAISIFPPGR